MSINQSNDKFQDNRPTSVRTNCVKSGVCAPVAAAERNNPARTWKYIEANMMAGVRMRKLIAEVVEHLICSLVLDGQGIYVKGLSTSTRS